jgi:hypothetical protein
MSRKVIHHIRDLQSQRLLATVVALDTPEGVQVGWSIANWSASGKKESVFVAGMEIVDFNPQPSKKLGVFYATLNAKNNFQPIANKKAYVRHGFVKTDLMPEIYKIAENLRIFLETPKKVKPKMSGKETDQIKPEPFNHAINCATLVDIYNGGGGCCGPDTGEENAELTCFVSSEFAAAAALLEEYFGKLQKSLNETSKAFKDFCEAGSVFGVIEECCSEAETGPETEEPQKPLYYNFPV